MMMEWIEGDTVRAVLDRVLYPGCKGEGKAVAVGEGENTEGNREGKVAVKIEEGVEREL